MNRSERMVKGSKAPKYGTYLVNCLSPNTLYLNFILGTPWKGARDPKQEIKLALSSYLLTVLVRKTIFVHVVLCSDRLLHRISPLPYAYDTERLFPLALALLRAEYHMHTYPLLLREKTRRFLV